jgi:hypothetical protein
MTRSLLQNACENIVSYRFNFLNHVAFGILTEVTMESTIAWDATTFTTVEVSDVSE